MTPANKQQEVLFFKETTLAQTELKPINPSVSNSIPLSDQLEDAFWNGMLFEILPELKEKKTEHTKMFLWQINNHSSFMCINMSNTPEALDHELSIDPYLFVQKQFMN